MTPPLFLKLNQMSLVQPYFAHDINAVNDFKIQAMMYEFGVAGYGMFWVICEALSSKAMVDVEQMNHFIKSCCEEYELFVTDGESIWSESLSKRMEKSRGNVDRAKKAAQARWNKPKSKAKSDSPTKKETKRTKAVPIEDRKLTFGESLSPFVKEFGRDMVKDFYEYWTEHGDNDTKMRFEKQKTWSTKSRLNRWRSNNFGGNKKESVSTNNIFNFGN
jgi:hypothetical protein